MMALDCDPDAMRAMVDLLKPLQTDERLQAIERAVKDHGGCWDLPSEKPDAYRPVLMSVQLFGICAFASTAEELVINWIRAAENVLA